MHLRKFDVTVQVFHIGDPDGGARYVLPVDSSDAEHAVAAAMSNAVAFTPKLDGDVPLPVAFHCLAIVERLA